MLTVACVWVKANVPYSADYVVKLRAMVKRHLTVPHRFICLTDQPRKLPEDMIKMGVTIVPGLPGWWAKVFLFSPELAHYVGGSRWLYLDLDSIVVDSLNPIVDYPAPFALVPHAGTFNGRNGLAVVKRFNSSVMVWDTPSETERLYTRFDSTVTSRLWGDQDWIGEQMPHAATMPSEWFPRISSIGIGGPDEDAIVVLAKKPKNADAAKLYDWVRDAWRAA